MDYIQVDSTDLDFIQLCNELDQFLNVIAGGEENRAQYIAFNQSVDIDNVIIAYDNNYPAGCAGIKHFDPEHAEVKRVFVRPQYRGRGISKKLMKQLEETAGEAGYKYLILESGEPLKAAMQLYRNLGYQVIPNYGPYRCMGESICMKKELCINKLVTKEVKKVEK